MRRMAWPILLVALALAPAARSQPADPHEAGVTTAANPSVEGVPPLSGRHALLVGVTVFEHERVISAADGQAQLLFRDGSSFTVGPNADLVLDEFDYDAQAGDGAAGKGRIALTLGKGVFRFVGGVLSKSGAVGLTTPTALLGVRGGIALIEVAEDGATTATLLHGEALTVTARSGETARITRAGFSVTVPDARSGPSEPARRPADALRRTMDALRGQPDRQGGLAQRPIEPAVEAALRAPVMVGGAAGGPLRPGGMPMAMPSPFGAGDPGGPPPGGMQGPPLGMRPPAMAPPGPPAPAAAQARQRQMLAPTAP
jgi:hypothetical protein